MSQYHLSYSFHHLKKKVAWLKILHFSSLRHLPRLPRHRLQDPQQQVLLRPLQRRRLRRPRRRPEVQPLAQDQPLPGIRRLLSAPVRDPGRSGQGDPVVPQRQGPQVQGWVQAGREEGAGAVVGDVAADGVAAGVSKHRCGAVWVRKLQYINFQHKRLRDKTSKPTRDLYRKKSQTR